MDKNGKILPIRTDREKERKRRKKRKKEEKKGGRKRRKLKDISGKFLRVLVNFSSSTGSFIFNDILIFFDLDFAGDLQIHNFSYTLLQLPVLVVP